MYVLALGGTAAHFIVVTGYPIFTRRIPGSKWSPVTVQVTYLDGRGVLREALSALTGHGFTVGELAVDRSTSAEGQVVVTLEVMGKGSVVTATALLDQLDGVIDVTSATRGEAP